MINLWDDEVMARTISFISEVKTGRNLVGNRLLDHTESINTYFRWLTRRMERAEKNEPVSRSTIHEGP